MSPKPPRRHCQRCSELLIAGVTIEPDAGTLHGCPGCGLLHIVRELGEMGKREDRADTDEWGHMGWA